MRRSRAPSIAPDTFFVAQSWAGCITNMPGFDLQQAQPDPASALQRRSEITISEPLSVIIAVGVLVLGPNGC